MIVGAYTLIINTPFGSFLPAAVDSATGWAPVIDPALLPGLRMFAGGILKPTTGAPLVTLTIRFGGSSIDEGADDGTLVFTSPQLAPPIVPFSFDLGVVPMVGPTRVKLDFRSTGGNFSLENPWFAFISPTAEDLPVGPVEVTVPDTDPFGQDIDVVSDLPPSFHIVGGFQNLGNALARRLGTPEGALEAIGDDPDYGYDLRQLLNADLTAPEIQAVPARIERECEKDERVLSCQMTSMFVPESYELGVDLSIDTAAGPFRLVLGIGQVSVDLINAGLSLVDAPGLGTG